jgi:lipopolysaccharide export LptBFGC system permease protein LptF
MKRIGKSMFVVITLSICMMLTYQTAKASVKEEKAKALKEYKNILVDNPYKNLDGGGFTAETFNIKDLNGDGIPELIINEEVPNILTYKDGQIRFIYNSWVYCNLYYSEKTGNIMFYNSWNGTKSYSFYEFNKDGTELNTLKSFDYSDKQYTYYANETIKKISKATFNKQMKKYMPERVKLDTPYKNTKENRTKYLK